MKNALAATLIILAVPTYALIVETGPVVLQHASEAQIAAYQGTNDTPYRLIAVSDKEGTLALFDPATTNWYYIAGTLDTDYSYNVVATTNASANATALSEKYASAKSFADIDGANAVYGPVVSITGGRYDFGNTTVTFNADHVTVGGPPLAFKATASVSTVPLIFGGRFSATLSTTNASGFVVSGEGASFNGLAFLGNVSISANNACFMDCAFLGTNTIDSSISYMTMENCHVKALAGSVGPSKQAYIHNSRIMSAMPRVASTGSLTMSGCHVMGSGSFSGEVAGYGDTYTMTISDSIVSGQNAFQETGIYQPVNNYVFTNVRFMNTTTNWFPINVAANASCGSFLNCSGVSSVLTNTPTTIVNCTDQNGNPIPNQ